MPFFGVRPPPPLTLAVHIGRLYTALAIVQSNRSSRDALIVRSWFSMPSLASDRRRRCALAVPIGRLYCFCHRARRTTRSYKSKGARCAHGTRCPSLASDRHRCNRCCALAVHIGRLYRSRHRAGRLFESTRARCALTDSLPCPTSDGTRHLRSGERTHFRFGVALQRWPSAKLALCHQRRRSLEQRRVSSLHPRVSWRLHVLHDAHLQRRRRRHGSRSS